jgi:putative ATP-binding cassette transporter
MSRAGEKSKTGRESADGRFFMRLINLLLRESRTSLRRLAFMAAVAGGTNAGILAVVNTAATGIGEGASQFPYVLLFALTILTYLYAQRYVLIVSSEEVEDIVHRHRKRLLESLKACELKEVEHIGRGQIYSAISADTQTISQSAGALVLGVQAAILIVWTSIYLGFISPASLVITLGILGVASRIYRQKIETVRQALFRAHREGSALHDQVNGLLDGFKEIKLSSRKALEVLADAVRVSARTAAYRVEAQRALAANFIFAQTAFFVLLGTLVFVMPHIYPSYGATIMKSMTVVMFLIGPISGMITAVPQVAVANAAAENLETLGALLQERIRERNGVDGAGEAVPPTPSFSRIELRRAFFTHDVSHGGGFCVGPIDLTIRAGETIFITGGNGSGKTTFLKLLTALYPPSQGELLRDGAAVTSSTAQSYRDLFCAVFSDFHLFARMYGVDAPDPDLVTDWLAEMEITDKVRITGDHFSTVDLSTGQRKRLAFIAAQMENKPIVVLDEWAADQDPHFRAKFYHTLLPRLKAAGKTVIAITHDDRYFDVADRCLHMDEGQLRERTEKTLHG